MKLIVPLSRKPDTLRHRVFYSAKKMKPELKMVLKVSSEEDQPRNNEREECDNNVTIVSENNALIMPNEVRV